MYRPFVIIAFLFSVLPALQTKAQLSNAGLVLYLPMDGNTNDASGNNYAVTPFNMLPAPDVNGTPNKAMRFDLRGHAMVNDPALLRGEHEELTILMKLYIDSIGTPYGLFSYPSFFFWHFIKQDPQRPLKEHMEFFAFTRTTILMPRPTPVYKIWGVHHKYWLRDCSNQTTDENYDFYEKDSARMIGQWFSYAFVFNKGNLKIYHNCKKVFEMNTSIGRIKPCETENNDPMRLYFGNWKPLFPGNTGRNISGMLDELRIYKRALAEEEIKTYAGDLCVPEIEPFINIRKDPCYNNRYRISDSSVTYNIPVVSRRWEVLRDGYVVNDSAGFDYTCTRFGNYSIRMILTDINGYRYLKDTTFLVNDVTEKHFLSTDRNPLTLCGTKSANVNITGGTSYQWLPCVDLSACDAASVTVTPQTDRVYTVAAVNAMGCRDTLLLTVKKSSDTSDVYIPTVFTPNNDGVNDVFGIHQPASPTGFLLEVYNRWGALVFKTKDPQMGWTGTLNNKPQPAGVYVWRLRYTGGRRLPRNKEKRNSNAGSLITPVHNRKIIISAYIAHSCYHQQNR